MSPKEQFEENTFCWRICCGKTFLGFWVNFLALLAGKFEMVNKRMCIIVSDVLSTDFITKLFSFSKTVGIGQKHLRFLARNYRQCCQKIKLHVQKKKNSRKTHKCFLTFSVRNFQCFAKKRSTTLWKLHSMCPKN